MPDTLWVTIGGPLQIVTGPLVADIDPDRVGITEFDVVPTTFGDTQINKTVNDRVRLNDNASPLLFDDTGGGDFPQRSPTARQFLGLDAMPSGWASRTQYVTNSHVTNGITYNPVVRAKGTMADNETVDLRHVQCWHHANNQAAVQLNFVDNTVHADSGCSVRPALIGSYAKNSSDFTPKAQVGRVWGTQTAINGITPVPAYTNNGSFPNSWQEWKSLGSYQNQTVDGKANPWDGPGRSYINCKPGAWTNQQNWCFVDGVWFRDPMDGISSNGSPIEVRNCLVQNNHDDGHWMGGNPVPPPVYLYKNLYWNIFMGVSYLESSQPPAAGGEFTTFDSCVYGFTRALPFHYGSDPLPQTFYDNHAHANHLKWRGPTNRPKLNWINTVMLMLGEPRENGLGQLCAPIGSKASNSHFIYYDMGNNSGDKPPNYPDDSTQWWQRGSTSLYNIPGLTVHVVQGADLNGGVCTLHGDHPIRDFLWPACQNWIDEHPQYGIADMTTDFVTNNKILLAT